jgi:ATP-dependent helicase/nuclease subunit B
MNKDFLYQLAQYIHDKNYDLEHTWMVLPSKRAGTFFINYLSEIKKSTFIAPQILSVTDLLDQLNPVQKIDKIETVIRLYSSYCKILQAQNKIPEGFDEFLSWSGNLLKDFGDLDRYLINTNEFFSHINDAKAIELWNLDGSPLTAGEEEFIAFWKNLGFLYHDFQQQCIDKNEFSSSLHLKNTAQNISQIIQKIPEHIQIVIAGLNALTAAEEKIINALVNTQKAEIIWDMDAYYVKNNIQEAGIFMRRYLQKWPNNNSQWLHKSFEEAKNITIYECNSRYGQVKAMASNLQKQSPTEALRTAVVLNEEDLLLPMLYALPNNVETANITMGYALDNTPLANLITTLLDIWRKSKGNKQAVYYYKDVFKLIDHPFAAELFGKNTDFNGFKTDIQQYKKVYLSKNFIAKYLGEEMSLVCFPEDSDLIGGKILHQLLKIIQILKENIEKGDAADLDKGLKIEYLYHYTIALRKLTQTIDKHFVEFNLNSAKSLIKQVLNKEKISFFGEPLSGIQIMGMLETRAIDFDTVYILSANEGVLPQGRKNNSFFPFDIAKYYGLPTHHEQDAIFAYYFYRLIQKAKNVHLFYYTSSDGLGTSGEPSRFIQQIQKELPEYSTNHSINFQTYAPSPNLDKKTKTIQKSPEVIAKFKNYLQGAVSPSAINTYLNCNMDFYYKYLLGLKEEEELEENIGSASFGTVIHNTLEKLYQPTINRVLKIADIEFFQKNFKHILMKEFEDTLNADNIKTGFNQLQFTIAQNYINQFLEKEKIFLTKLGFPYTIISLENSCEVTVNLNTQFGVQTVNLKGTVDRLGKYSDTYHLVDYKTGKVEGKNLNFTNNEKLIDGTKSKAVQLQLYAYLLLKKAEFSDLKNIEASIFSFKNQKEGYIYLTLNKENQSTQEIISNTEEILTQIVEDMLDNQKNIEHNPQSLYCVYC